MIRFEAAEIVVTAHEADGQSLPQVSILLKDDKRIVLQGREASELACMLDLAAKRIAPGLEAIERKLWASKLEEHTA